MLAAKNGYKDVVLILTKKEANLDWVNEVSVQVHSLYYDLIKLELLNMYIYMVAYPI